MKTHLVPAILALSFVAAPAIAQTANSSPAAGLGGAGGNGAAGDVSRSAPSVGTAKPAAATPGVGPETPVEKKAEERSEKDTNICKGC